MSGQAAELGSLLKVRALVEPCLLVTPIAGEPFTFADWQVEAPAADIPGSRPLNSLIAYSGILALHERSFDATA